MKKLMILGASILQLPAIKKAKEMGLLPVVVDMNPDAVGFRENDILKEVISTIDIPAVVAAAEKHRVDGVITLASDMPMRSVAAVARELGIVGISDETAIKATDKGEMRKALSSFGVPVPKFFVASCKDDYDKVISFFTKPFIVKPADNSGSRGVVKIDDPEDRRATDEAYEYSLKSSRNGKVVVEEYMSGPEVSVETLTVDGECHVIQITDKITTGAPHFVEMGHTQPSRLSADITEQIRSIAIAANKAVGIDNGPSHTEIIVTDEGPKIVELGARLGGDCITTHLVPLSTGMNMVEYCIRIALGEKPDFSEPINRGSAIRYFPQHSGTVKSIDGIEEAEAVDGVVQISIVHGVGEKITDVTDSGSRMGFVIAQGSTADEAEKVCENAMKKIKISIC